MADISLAQASPFLFWTKLPTKNRSDGNEIPHGAHWYNPIICSISGFDLAVGVVATKVDFAGVDWTRMKNGVAFTGNTGRGIKNCWHVVVFPLSAILSGSERACEPYTGGWQSAFMYGRAPGEFVGREALIPTLPSQKIRPCAYQRIVVIDGAIAEAPCADCPNVFASHVRTCDWLGYNCIDGAHRFASRLADVNDPIHTPDLEALFGADKFVEPKRAIDRRPFESYTISQIRNTLPEADDDGGYSDAAKTANATKRYKHVMCTKCVYGGLDNKGKLKPCLVRHARRCHDVFLPEDADVVVQAIDVRLVDVLMSNSDRISPAVFRAQFPNWHKGRSSAIRVRTAMPVDQNATIEAIEGLHWRRRDDMHTGRIQQSAIDSGLLVVLAPDVKRVDEGRFDFYIVSYEQFCRLTATDPVTSWDMLCGRYPALRELTPIDKFNLAYLSGDKWYQYTRFLPQSIIASKRERSRLMIKVDDEIVNFCAESTLSHDRRRENEYLNDSCRAPQKGIIHLSLAELRRKWKEKESASSHD